MKKFVIALVLVQFAAYSNASPGLEGEYVCDSCHGYLTVKASKVKTYKVWLGTGGGSCGGEVFAKSDMAQAVGNTITFTWKLKNRVCKTKISIEGAHAFVSDSCTRPEDEDDSTCAVLGEYTKREKER
ncbi:hypothetical protein INH39_25670 [Massilia violaceinigra]|uniref:Uncharacterized protein n=1 Tax=Massilia violaceinigra TaxID=2045208 RepID=A0ABY4A247_9BURK|nr:hypothetical protein [Massilia violaceinigra]UOD28801.1 hypothetical protein INH39_25670 [Massilia violaceinigra]